MKMIVAPVTIPATYHSHVQPKFTDAYQIIVMIDSNKKTEPSSNSPRMRKMIPANTPANENDPRISGSHGEFATVDKDVRSRRHIDRNQREIPDSRHLVVA